MIFSEHKFGSDMTVGPGGLGGGTEIMTVEVKAHHEAGFSITGWEPLQRADVERLRDLCNEALA